MTDKTLVVLVPGVSGSGKTAIAGQLRDLDHEAISLDGYPGLCRTLHLPGRYSCATVLFSAIGYMQGETDLRQAVAAIAAHLEPGGVLLMIEPWFTPDQWRPGTVHQTRYEDENRTVVRLACSSNTGNRSTMDMRYLLGEKNSGVTYWHDQHVLTLFSKAEYDNAMTASGLTDVEWVPGWAHGRDRIIASKPGRRA